MCCCRESKCARRRCLSFPTAQAPGRRRRRPSRNIGSISCVMRCALAMVIASSPAWRGRSSKSGRARCCAGSCRRMRARIGSMRRSLPASTLRRCSPPSGRCGAGASPSTGRRISRASAAAACRCRSIRSNGSATTLRRPPRPQRHASRRAPTWRRGSICHPGDRPGRSMVRRRARRTWSSSTRRASGTRSRNNFATRARPSRRSPRRTRSIACPARRSACARKKPATTPRCSTLWPPRTRRRNASFIAGTWLDRALRAPAFSRCLRLRRRSAYGRKSSASRSPRRRCIR